jgi:predicted tellurium resistance membrane protein TerC
MQFPDLASGDFWISLLTLTFLEIVLGIDNIIFITIVASRLHKKDQKRARSIGLVIAMLFRVILLFGITAFMSMQKSLFSFDTPLASGAVSIQSLILVAGGLFLLYKAASEIFEKLEGIEHPGTRLPGKKVSLGNAIIQISLINLVFSFDSILTAVGLTKDVTIMILAVVISILIMMAFAGPVGNFVNNHPSIQMLGLSFLILIGFMLIAEGAHEAHLVVVGAEIGSIPRGYLYFAIAFSLFVEFLNIRMRKRREPVQLHSASREAFKKGLMDQTSDKPHAGHETGHNV